MQAPLADTFRLVAQVVIVFNVVATTVIYALSLHGAFPASLTVMVTVVVLPSASAVLAAGLCVIVNEPEADALELPPLSPLKCRLRPVQEPLADTFRLVARVVIEGGVTSTPVILAVHGALSL